MPRIRLLSFTLVITVLWVSHPAHTQQHEARKFDEFGDVQYSDLIARLDNFAIALENEPSVKGFVVVYRSRRDLPGLSNRYALRAKAYFVNSRGVPKERLVIVDGGDADCLTHELWIIPPGTAPTPRPDAYSRNFPDVDSVRKIDEFGYELGGNAKRRDLTEYPTEADRLETFATYLRSEKNSKACIIGYAHFSRKKQLVGDYDYLYYEPNDPPGSVFRRLRLEKNVLVKTYGIAPSRIRLVNGGYRKWRTIELWIVPRGERPPIPTPNSFPPRPRQPRS